MAELCKAAADVVCGGMEECRAVEVWVWDMGVRAVLEIHAMHAAGLCQRDVVSGKIIRH